MFRLSAYSGNSGYPTLVQETRGGVTKTLTSNSGALLMPLFSGFDNTAASIPFRSHNTSAKNPPLQKWVHFGHIENASGEKWNFLGQYFNPLRD